MRDRECGSRDRLLTHVKAYIEDLSDAHPWPDPQPPGGEADKVGHVLMRDVDALGLAGGACALHQYRIGRQQVFKSAEGGDEPDV